MKVRLRGSFTRGKTLRDGEHSIVVSGQEALLRRRVVKAPACENMTERASQCENTFRSQART